MLVYPRVDEGQALTDGQFVGREHRCRVMPLGLFVDGRLDVTRIVNEGARGAGHARSERFLDDLTVQGQSGSAASPAGDVPIRDARWVCDPRSAHASHNATTAHMAGTHRDRQNQYPCIVRKNSGDSWKPAASGITESTPHRGHSAVWPCPSSVSSVRSWGGDPCFRAGRKPLHAVSGHSV